MVWTQLRIAQSILHLGNALSAGVTLVAKFKAETPQGWYCIALPVTAWTTRAFPVLRFT